MSNTDRNIVDYFLQEVIYSGVGSKSLGSKMGEKCLANELLVLSIFVGKLLIQQFLFEVKFIFFHDLISIILYLTIVKNRVWKNITIPQ